MSLAPPLSAHHSFAMFDRSKSVVIQGRVHQVEYKNPHVYLFVDVSEEGASKRYAIECASINFLNQIGWKVNTIKAGDSVTVTMSPLRDGRAGGQIKTVMLDSGRVIQANP